MAKYFPLYGGKNLWTIKKLRFWFFSDIKNVLINEGDSLPT